MRLRFKHQRFQADAASAVVGVFEGQPYSESSYLIDKGVTRKYVSDVFAFNTEVTGFNNEPIVTALTEEKILENIQKIQRKNQIKPSAVLEGKYNLTIEMETGVGKTYTYIKTMYELNRAYGWSKFIVVVPSIAIREGVYKTFQVTQDHFAEEYGKKIRFFIYNSMRLSQIQEFATSSSINVMIINSQAFNAKGKDARRIHMELDEFRSRRPIDVIARTNPIMIIDEPQSVEGKQTKENLKLFNPMITLRYSATHKTDSIYNLIYRLDAIDAYNKKLVKRIAVKGITEIGTTATQGYVYLERINLSTAAPTATLEFDYRGAKGLRKVSRIVSEGYNLYDNSGELEEYKDGYTVSRIDGRDNCVEFVNGIKLYAGDVIGKVSEEQIRRIQIRETILSHIERERELFQRGIKVLSLFFIDEVAKYKQYDAGGTPFNGSYAKMFEEEYEDIITHLQTRIGEEAYMGYLSAIPSAATHAGYFSIDKQGKLADSKAKGKEKMSDDINAYDLIMKNKELLLDLDPNRSPVRFIFSHSALREGWDNPNVFQICTLKQSSSDVRKRQEVGRGLRLCVNQDGERMDTSSLGEDVHNVNILTVIASESYDSFAKGLQNEIAEDVSDRPRVITADLFVGKNIVNAQGNTDIIDKEIADTIYYELVSNQYIDRKGGLTEKYYADKANNSLNFAEDMKAYLPSVVEIIDTIYDDRNLMPENARSRNVEIKINEDIFKNREFKTLWKKINRKSVYVVNFDTEELIAKAIRAIDSKLLVSKVFFKVTEGTLKSISSKEVLEQGAAFKVASTNTYSYDVASSSSVTYDLIGKLVEETGLTRKDIVRILQGIRPSTFDQFKENPEEFITKVASLINDEKATVIVQHITYNRLDEVYDTDIFTAPTMKGRLGVDTIKTNKNLFNFLLYDSSNEKEFASKLDAEDEVALYVKLPAGFFISTPVGRYNPDWAIAFNDNSVKHVYFVAETKGSMNSMQLRKIEEAKIHCAEEHFKAISGSDVKYGVISDIDDLIKLFRKLNSL